MPSSTFSSSPAATATGTRLARAWIVATAILCLAMLAALELGARTLLPRSSRILGRMERERLAARGLKPDGSAKKRVLLVGNSLILEALDLQALQQELGNEFDARSYIVEQTTIYDWYYGLRRLYAEGTRPDIVVISLARIQCLSDRVRGDIFAHYLMRMRDLPDVAQRLKLHPTEASSFAFANLSSFYGTRNEFRKVILGRLLPTAPQMFALITDTSDPARAPMPGRIAERLAAIRDEAAVYGARVVLLTPPMRGPRSIDEEFYEAGRISGVPVVNPVPIGEFDAALFRDIWHVTKEGRALYTERAVPVLAAALRH